MKHIKKISGQFSVESLLQWLVTTDERFNRTGPGIRLGVRIEDAVTAAQSAPYVAMQVDHYEQIAEAAENPTSGYPPLYAVSPDGSQERLPGSARAWLPALDAIRAATDTPPPEVTP